MLTAADLAGTVTPATADTARANLTRLAQHLEARADADQHLAGLLRAAAQLLGTTPTHTNPTGRRTP